ncbi:MAG: oligosaccharide flippase family protein [Muribaculaceae bacterium]|nr:oligosaccharide flippase family protein [Muribaculaceae bacterium]
MNALKDTSRACPESGGVRSGLMWSAMLTGATYVFPLIVYPHVSRVLGVADIGLVGFIDSVVTWFILISMMGISILGIRETAKAGGSPEGLGRVLSGLLAVNGVMTLVCLVAMAAVTVAVPQLREHWRLMGVGMCKLLFNLFIVEWFWRGIGKFRYITVRTVVVRAAYVAAVFLTVKGPDDTFLYYFLTMTVVAVTAAVNMWRTRLYVAFPQGIVSLRRAAEDARRYARPFFSLGTYMLLTAFYTTLNVVILGFVSTDTEVGYYSTAVKLFSIFLALITALGMAVMPRTSVLASQGRRDVIRKESVRYVRVLICAAVPVSVLGVVFAPEAVMLLCGPGYEGAVLPVRIIFPFIVVFAIEQLLVMQILTPLGRDRAVNRNSLVAAAAGVVLNALLVPRFGAAGSAVVWVTCETIVMSLSIFSVRRALLAPEESLSRARTRSRHAI